MNSTLMHSSMRTSARPSMTCSARSLHPAGTVQLIRSPILSAPSPSPRSTSSSSQQGQLRQRQVDCQGLFGLGLPELAVIAGVAALIFGPSKLPELGKGLGKTVKSFQTGLKEFEVELKTATGDDKDATAVGSGSKTEEEKVKTTSDKL